MSDLESMERRVGITRVRRNGSGRASAQASAAVVAMLSIASPAVAAAPSQVKISSSHAQTANRWRVASNRKDATKQVQQAQEDSHSPPEQPAHVQALVDALSFAQVVARVMPVNEELDRRAASDLRKYYSSQPSRKLSKK